jgi:hypothetical protein
MRSSCEYVLIVKMTKDKRRQFSKHGTGESSIYEPASGTWSTIGNASTSKSTLWASALLRKDNTMVKKEGKALLKLYIQFSKRKRLTLGPGELRHRTRCQDMQSSQQLLETLVAATDADYLFPRRNRDSSLHWMVLKRPKVYPDSIDKSLVSQTSHASLSRSVSLLLYWSCSVNVRPGGQEDELQQKVRVRHEMLTDF